MNRKRINEAIDLIEQMTDRGDAPMGLGQVRQLLIDVLADSPDDDEMMELTLEPPTPKLRILP